MGNIYFAELVPAVQTMKIAKRSVTDRRRYLAIRPWLSHNKLIFFFVFFIGQKLYTFLKAKYNIEIKSLCRAIMIRPIKS